MLDREIGAVDKPAVLCKQGLVCVGVLNTFRAQTFLCPRHVGCAMCRLNRRDDVVFFVKHKILCINYLRVFNTPSQIVFAFQELGIFVENHAYSGIADGMAAHLITGIICFLADMVVKVLIFNKQSYYEISI